MIFTSISLATQVMTKAFSDLAQSLALPSHVPVMRAQMFHASSIMKVATSFKVQPVELSITCMKSPPRHPRDLTQSSQVASCEHDLIRPGIT
jgi:hypothetical protein